MPSVCTGLVDRSNAVVKKCLAYFFKFRICSGNFKSVFLEDLLVVDNIVVCRHVIVSHSVNLVAYRCLSLCKLIIGGNPRLIGKIDCVLLNIILGNNVKTSGLSSEDIRTLAAVQLCHQHIVILISRNDLIVHFDTSLFFELFAEFHLCVINPVLACHNCDRGSFGSLYRACRNCHCAYCHDSA